MKTHVRFLSLFLITAYLLAQVSGLPVNQTSGPPPQALQTILDYAGGSTLVYVGTALSDQGERGISILPVTAASNGSPVSFTCTACGFDYQSLATTLPVVKIAGATGNWTPINGVWVATPTGANAFTIAVDTGTFGALTGTLVVTTRAPLTTKAVWSISKNVYDAGSKLIWSGWAANPPGTGATPIISSTVAMQFAWASRATYGYQ